MDTIVYNDFSEIEDSLKRNAPEFVFKYRSWDNDFHKNLLKEKQIWFSHPKDLNDPYDCRPPFKFNISEVNEPVFFEKLLSNIPQEFANYSDEEKRAISLKRLAVIKENPEKCFQDELREIYNGHQFDNMGVFSTSKNSLSETLWANYAANHSGYCLGFKTVELVRRLYCTVRKVDYSDEPINYSFMKGLNGENLFFKKSCKWSDEEEFRFFTLRIGRGKNRLEKFECNDVSKIILGLNISEQNQNEILEIVKTVYNNSIPVFKVQIKSGGYGFVENQLI